MIRVRCVARRQCAGSRADNPIAEARGGRRMSSSSEIDTIAIAIILLRDIDAQTG
jgi:hypothetical protein